MILLRNFIVIPLFLAFMVGCTTPFIDIDVKHSSGGGPGGGGSCHPFAAAMGWCIPTGGASIPIEGKVTAKGPVESYTVNTPEGNRTVTVPPFVVNPVNGVPDVGSDVIVTLSNLEIRKK